MAKPKVKVVRLTTTEFELSDGRLYQHPVPLKPDELPTLQEFQSYYEYWFTRLSEKGNDREVVSDGPSL
jgi:hypothetical protein